MRAEEARQIYEQHIGTNVDDIVELVKEAAYSGRDYLDLDDLPSIEKAKKLMELGYQYSVVNNGGRIYVKIKW